MESSYKFMVKHVQLWKVAFDGTSPRFSHNIYHAALASLYAKYVQIASLPLTAHQFHFTVTATFFLLDLLTHIVGIVNKQMNNST
uniref:Diacylglycerol glucosyltransferase N-terminal domain-containing protein n=1 Tax=Triticum aestivum TaxID=4565 RepID=A0A077RXM2_WHEAT|nr:unnamed protein product [Triticum aestivum]